MLFGHKPYMIKVNIKKQSNYPVSAKDIKEKLAKFLESSGIQSDAVVNVSIVGQSKMLELASQYLGEKDVLHNVLSFPASETKGIFVYPPDGIIRLGEIVVCYPKSIEDAKIEGVLVSEKVYELIEHGARHLMGEHHE